MRKYQINIRMQLVNDDSDSPGLTGVTAYADSNDLWATVCSGFEELIASLRDAGYTFPTMCARSHGVENEVN